MSNEQKNIRLLNQDNLDALLRILAQEDNFSSVLSSEVIDDYIHGRAKNKDQALVESAMAQSSTIREQVLALTVIAQRGEDFAALEPPSPPPRRGMSDLQVGVFRGYRFRPPRRAVWLSLPGMAAAALVLWILNPITPSPPTNKLPLYSVSFDRKLVDEQFESDLRRTTNIDGSLPDPRHARDAALLSFFKAIEWQDGEFLIQSVPPEVGGERQYSLVFELGRDEDASSWTYEVLLPGEAEEPQTAILVLPDLDLYWVESKTWDGRVSFRQDLGQTLFLTVTYRAGGQYSASAPTMIPTP